MEPRPTLNVSLTPRLSAFVKSRVASGRYSSASELVRESLRLLEEREKENKARLKRLRGQIQHSLDQAKRGELADAETVLDRLERSLPQRPRPRRRT